MWPEVQGGKLVSLSILYLRCEGCRAGEWAHRELCAFNSLFEMPTSFASSGDTNS